MNDINLTVGERIKKKRMENSMTQQYLADKIGISKSSLAMYETNKREPNLLTIKKLCSTLHIDGNYLIGIESNNVIQDSIFDKYKILNQLGKQKAMEYINDLSENVKYTNKDIESDIIEETKKSYPIHINIK